ncbi:glycoside hydrolase family 1 protein [Thorsellia anophelis]|uniref:6-phospho-beta-glucosidase n=1 Tax=Thorsellia anophelis DSM 18579 TaxID=1123402 RepID=A0A1I0ERU8_9GAMM|nr:glycoside hydrolase family 1 protein [Thorsellia anophelis]SET48177.1 6-phospho-beta-glucosidase [Thorsellia anophelis DSM 18579]
MQYQQGLATFPPDFLWGASTSAYQVEGGVEGTGKGRSIIDALTHPEGMADFNVASDHYNRFKEDVALFKELGLKAYRFSIAWSRIFPDGIGEVNPKGVEFYRNLIDELVKNEIEPIITLYHFDLPYALQKIGGWSSRETISAFEAYADFLLNLFSSKVTYWLTINEQNTMILHPGAIGTDPDYPMISKQALNQQSHHMFLAQAKVYQLIHQKYPMCKVGPAINTTSMYQATSRPEDAIAAHNWETIRCYGFLEVAVNGRYHPLAWRYMVDREIAPIITSEDESILQAIRPDFIAINYYSTATIAESKGDSSDISARAGDQQIMLGEPGVYRAADNPFLDTTPYGWVVDPVGLRLTLRKVYERYNLPILISENGMGAPDKLETDGRIYDFYRISFYHEHIKQMQLAITDGVKLIGYCPWSAIDLVSTHQGYAKRYGFIYVNRDDNSLKDLRRIKKESFFWYQNLIRKNGDINDHDADYKKDIK